MADDDLRALLDPISVILKARPKWREIPEQVIEPPPVPEGPAPDPIVIPARTELYIDPAEVPDEIGTGQTLDLGAALANLQAAVAWMWGSQEIRSVSGRVTLTSGVYQPGTYEFPLTWDAAPLKTPTGGVVVTNAGVAWQGRTHAKIKPGSITSTGCTVTMTVVSSTVPSSGQPLTMEAQALYLYLPPYQP